MIKLLGLLKAILVLGLCIVGAAFVLSHVGLDIPYVKYGPLEARNLPVGIAFLIAGVALARFWRIQNIEREVTTTSSFGGVGSGVGGGWGTTTTVTKEIGSIMHHPEPGNTMVGRNGPKMS